MTVELTESEKLDLQAIVAYIKKNGKNSFKWDHASVKKMFYVGPIPGRWPNGSELARIRRYLRERKVEKSG